MTDLALKAQAKAYVQNKAVMTEGEWVSLLYRTKGRRMPEDLLDNRDFPTIAMWLCLGAKSN